MTTPTSGFADRQALGDPAVAAGAAQDDVVRGQLVAPPARDATERLLESAVLERLDLAAVAADEMVVMVAAWIDALEAGDRVAEVDPLHEPELVEAFERAVDACDTDPRSFRADAVMELLRGEAAVLATEKLDDDAPSAPAASAFGAHPVEHLLRPLRHDDNDTRSQRVLA